MDVKTLSATPPWQWTSGAGKIFLDTLNNRQADPSDRLTAAELAGDLVVMNEDLAAALLAIAGDGSEPEMLRGKAAIGLGPVLAQADIELIDDEDFDDPESVPISLHTFRRIQDALRQLFLEESFPEEVRRRILEASVRAPREWHLEAIHAAYTSGSPDWKLTAVFSMRWVRGFDAQILESLKSADPNIHYEAVVAAGNWELEAAWPHVVALVEDPSTPKKLLLGAIEAVGNIRPGEASEVLDELLDSPDEEVSEAASEAVSMAQAMSGEGLDEDREGDWVN